MLEAIATEHDFNLMKTACDWAQVEVNDPHEKRLTEDMFSVSRKKGGLGLTKFREMAPADYMASLRATIDDPSRTGGDQHRVTNRVKLSVFREPLYQKIVNNFQTVDRGDVCANVLVHNMQTKGIMNVLETNKPMGAPTEISALLRQMTGAPLRSAALGQVHRRDDLVKCPGCAYEATRAEFTSFHAEFTSFHARRVHLLP